ncbi:hypothetical protein JG688_00012151 [Phytophthora aleatoria]|uniref:Uncharacterized protein n=1 Tax=Phytophthora aleatoria TaxID=2496075 RepID=A0A8J5IZE7_9STRA|nr:hypothetical protein JG688_00012151 [Phytophthora aleatoria]
MVQEHRRLEETLQRALAAIEQRLGHGAKEQDLITKIQRLALERELLSSQKADLRAAILPYYKIHQLIKKQGFQVSDQERHECKEKNRSRIRDSRWIPALPTPDWLKEGWRVHFPNGEPSFFFHPFTHEEFDVHLKSCDPILENGRPMTTYATVIAASEANVRSQGAEESGSDVQWIREGGTYIKFAEVDKTTIDVTYEHWSSCRDEVHAHHLFNRWAQYAVRLQQWVLPTRLLTS